MSNKYIGRIFNVGLAHESTRGTATTTTAYWEAKTDLTFDEEIDQVVQNQSYGGIEDAQDAHTTTQRSKGSIGALIHDQSIGLIALLTYGAESAVSTVSTSVYLHTFTVAENNAHPTFTFVVNDPADGSGPNRTFPLGMVEQTELDFEIGKFGTYKVDFSANAGTVASGVTTTYTTQNIFLPQYANIYLASTYSGLSGASALTEVQKVMITIKKNTEEDITIGSLTPYDRSNKQFSIEGSFEAKYTSRTYIDTYLMADVACAMRVKLVNTDVFIASTYNPTIILDMARVKLQSVARKISSDNVITETIKFKAYYSISDSLMSQITVQNGVSAKY